MSVDEARFEFVPDLGLRYGADGKSFVLGAHMGTKDGVSLTDDEMIVAGQAIQRYMDSTTGLGERYYQASKIMSDRDFRTYDSTYAYKFVSEKTYSEFTKRGSFLMSSLQRFREMEHQGNPAGDHFEGISFCAYTVGTREIYAYSLSGFDTHIFSLARNLDNLETLKARFGPVVLRVKLQPFARSLAAQMKHSSAEIRLVRYADLKLHRSRISVGKIGELQRGLSEPMIKAIRERSRLPAVFAKPNRFQDEQEVRIAIYSEQDVEPWTAVIVPNFKQYVERIS